jgi:biotin synthase
VLELPQPFSISDESNKITQIARAVLSGDQITRTDALYLLQIKTNQPELYDLFYWANRIRLARFGPEVSLCSIASVRTGRCTEDCRFCAQSSHYQTDVKPQQLDQGQLLTAAENAIASGAHCFGLVSSGRSPADEEIDRLAGVIRQIVQSGRVRCSASLGCLSPSQAQQLFDLGVRRYNHNLETSRRFFPSVVTTHTYDDRIATVRTALQAGMQVCCGGIIGLGESLEDRVDLAVTLRDLNVDSVPLNFLNPIPGTPFARNEPIAPLAALQTIAMFRFVLPDRQIKIAGGREKCLGDLQSWMFFAGASSTMVGNYLTTTGRAADEDIRMLDDLELPLSAGE